MPIGNKLSANEQQYVALKDESGTWRVLNTWHDDIKHLDADSDIPDDSDSVVVFSEGQFISLIKEIIKCIVVCKCCHVLIEEGELNGTTN